MNVVLLSGNLCKDNELKYTTSNIAVLQNTIAVKNDYKNKEGEYDSQFINFVAYINNAEFLNKYTQKGSKVMLEGKWNTITYDNKEGNKVYVNEMIVDKVELIGSKPTEKKQEPKPEEQQTNPYKEFADENEVELQNFELPF